jgi:hypothetical protein
VHVPSGQGPAALLQRVPVREAAAARTFQETFGSGPDGLAENSQSGFNAPRACLSRFTLPGRRALFSESIGPIGSPIRTLEALRTKHVDVVALDTFLLDLLRRHDPAKLDGMQCVATMPWTPIPLLVAAPGILGDVVESVRAYLLGAHMLAEYELLISDALLLRFAATDRCEYPCSSGVDKSGCLAS